MQAKLVCRVGRGLGMGFRGDGNIFETEVCRSFWWGIYMFERELMWLAPNKLVTTPAFSQPLSPSTTTAVQPWAPAYLPQSLKQRSAKMRRLATGKSNVSSRRFVGAYSPALLLTNRPCRQKQRWPRRSKSDHFRQLFYVSDCWLMGLRSYCWVLVTLESQPSSRWARHSHQSWMHRESLVLTWASVSKCA